MGLIYLKKIIIKENINCRVGLVNRVDIEIELGLVIIFLVCGVLRFFFIF